MEKQQQFKTYEEVMLERIEKSPLKKFQEKLEEPEENIQFILEEGIYCKVL